METRKGCVKALRNFIWLPKLDDVVGIDAEERRFRRGAVGEKTN